METKKGGDIEKEKKKIHPDYKNLTTSPPCFGCDKEHCNYRSCLEYRIWFASEWATVRARFASHKKEGDEREEEEIPRSISRVSASIKQRCMQLQQQKTILSEDVSLEFSIAQRGKQNLNRKFPLTTQVR